MLVSLYVLPNLSLNKMDENIKEKILRRYVISREKYELVKKSSRSYEILSHRREVGFRGFIKYICLILIADLNPLKGTL